MSEQTQYPWLFKGAYATYYGASRMGRPPAEFQITYKLEVEDIDIANNRVKIHSIGNLSRKALFANKKLTESDERDWMAIGEKSFISKTPYVIEGECESELHIENIGLRQCIIQQFAIPSSLSKGIIFWDKEFIWPLQYITLIRRVSETSTNLLDITKEVCDTISKVSGWNLDSALKKSKNVYLRENSIVVPLKETNIPFVPSRT